MSENPLELASGFDGLTDCEVRQSADVNGIEAAEASGEADAAEREIVARGGRSREAPFLPTRFRRPSLRPISAVARRRPGL
jgi:hypothetical protein